MCWYRKTMPNCLASRRKIKKLPTITLVALWAHWGTRDYHFSGRYTRKHGYKEPLVWDYTDRNGTADEWILVPITHVTTGFIKTWSTDKIAMEKLAMQLEQEERQKYRSCYEENLDR